MTKEIKEDVVSRSHRKWEKLYKKICEARKETEEPQNNEETEVEDISILYCEV